MASTYTNRLRLELQGDGENPNSWGTILNQNTIELLDTAVAGYQIVSVSSVGVSLTTQNGSVDTSRSFGLRFDGTLTAAVTVTIPQKEKIYFLFNNTSGSFGITVKTASGTAVSVVDSGNGMIAACDSININKFFTGTINLVTGVTGTLPIGNGGTNATTAATARTALDVPSNAEAILDTLIDAKGDLIVGTADNTVARIAVGSNTHVLTADSAEASGVKWAVTASPTVVTQAQMEAASDNAATVTALAVKWSPSAAKAWAVISAAGTLTTGHNISSITDNGTGDRTVNFTTSFSSANYVGVGIAAGGANEARILQGDFNNIPTASAFRFLCVYFNGTLVDQTNYIVFFGDQ